jgi:hypothetical protein
LGCFRKFSCNFRFQAKIGHAMYVFAGILRLARIVKGLGLVDVTMYALDWDI